MVKPFVIAFILVFALLTGVTLGTWRATKDRHLANEAAALLKKKEDIRVTIIEGKRWEEIATQLDTAGITKYADFTAVMKEHPEYEGTLFPNTYRFFPNTPAVDVIQKLQETYVSQLAGLTPTDDQIILASIIEREAQNDSERATIAGVYQNRLAIGMKLDADPTVQYGKDTNAFVKAGSVAGFEFWKPILRADYNGVVSIYNTYQNKGLPPTAICNPGLKSILAAMNPEKHSYYYFLHKDGKLLPSKTLGEHQAKQL